MSRRKINKKKRGRLILRTAKRLLIRTSLFFSYCNYIQPPSLPLRATKKKHASPSLPSTPPFPRTRAVTHASPPRGRRRDGNVLRDVSHGHIAAEADRGPSPAVVGHDGQDFVDAAHGAPAALDQALDAAADPSGSLLVRPGAAEHLAPLADPHALQPGALLAGAVDLDVRAGGQDGGREGGEVDVGADVDLARVREGGDEPVGADAAQSGGGDGVRGAVVEDQGGARRVRFRRGEGGGRGACGRRRGSADSVGKVRGVRVRFRGDFDERGRVFEDGGVARRESGKED